MVDGYRRISLFHQEIEIPQVPLHEDVELHLVPDLIYRALEVRIWFQYKMVHSLTLPLDPRLFAS